MSKVKPPGIWAMAKSFSRDLTKYVKEGAPNVTEKDYRQRLSDCNSCEYLIKEKMRCGKCGCLIEHKAKSKKEIIQTLATKYNLPLEKVEKIVNSQFKYVTKIMSRGKFDSVRLPYFGRFYSKKERRDILNGITRDS